ncbi:hypothetical protein [Methyloversatilis discipulorum]|uniref:hypothetical protein n=1 Tax=Methyloversatilis discipulorum TaxID=1119528 RepID=UPI000380B7A3|nr:hypothetical protein [Methyloversatilis discipulorum]
MLALDQVAMIIDSTGTDEVQSMSGAAPGYRAVSAVIDTLGLSLPIGISYRIEDGAAWELGVGRITSGGYLERTTVTASSASGSRINIAGDPDPAIMYIVASALSAAAVTPHVEAWSPALGAQVREDIEGGTALGSGALVFQEDGTALGAITSVWAIGATAVGARSQGGVMESVCSGFSASHGVQWAGAATTTNDEPSPARSARGIGFAPPAISAMLLDIQVVAFRTSPTNAMYAATMKAGVMRLGETAAPVIVDATTPEVIAASAGVTCSIDIGVNSDPIESGRDQELAGVVDVLVTGAAGETWHWAVVIRSAMHG